MPVKLHISSLIENTLPNKQEKPVGPGPTSVSLVAIGSYPTLIKLNNQPCACVCAHKLVRLHECVMFALPGSKTNKCQSGDGYLSNLMALSRSNSIKRRRGLLYSVS